MHTSKISTPHKKHEGAGLSNCNDANAFVEHSTGLDCFYKNTDDYNPGKRRKGLIAFADIIGDIIGKKKINPRVTRLFIRGRKLNIYLVFITRSCFAVP